MAGSYDVQASAAKWQRNYQASTQSAKEGVMRVTQSPGQAAAAQRAQWAAKMSSPDTQDKWARKVAAVSTSAWQDAYVQKGIPRMQAGAVSGRPKVDAHLAKFLPHVASGVAALPPRGDLEANLQRANAMARHNANFRS